MKYIFLFLFASLTLSLHAQTDFKNIKLDTEIDLRAANPSALIAADYILTTPIDATNDKRMEASRFLIKWMTGTPEYSFPLNPSAVKLVDKNTELLGVYMAAMTKYALEHTAVPLDDKAMELNAVKTTLDYATNSKNNVKMTGELKKFVNADKKGELAAYVASLNKK
jgi:hypothetical protein